MVKFLRRIAVFIGVVLLVMTAGLWRLRETQPAPQSYLLFWENIVDRQSNYAYYQMIEGADKPFLMRSGKQGLYDYPSEYLGMSENNHWVYFTEHTGGYERNVFRVRPNGSDKERIITDAYGIEWMPTQNAFIYTGLAENGMTFYRANADGTDKIRLFDQPLHVGQFVMPSNHEAIYFMAFENGNAGIYEVNAEGGQPEKFEIPLGEAAPINLMTVTPDNQWLILVDSNHAYRMRTDGTQFMELGNWADEASNFNMKLLQNDILVVQNHQGYHAVRISTGKRLWSARNSPNSYRMAYFGFGAEWVFLWWLEYGTSVSNVRVIRADGSQQRELTYPLDYDRYFDLKWTDDGQDLYYPANDMLHHLNVDWTETERVATARTPAQNGVPQLRYLGVSNDKSWAYYAEFDYPVAYIYKIHPDGSDKMMMVAVPVSEWFILDRQSRYPFIKEVGKIEAGWEPIQLWMAGVLFIVLGIRQPIKIRVWG